MRLVVNTKDTYDVIIERGSIYKVKEYLKHEGSVFIVSDTGVPQQYIDIVKNQFDVIGSYVFEQGEENKNLDTWKKILEKMLTCHVSRKDCVIAIGGGVVGDMAGFASACYMRGIAYVNIPTTSLSQIDSSIGGKTAVDFAGTKNTIGAFWQPKLVVVDPSVLETLPKRHLHNGLVEAVKEGLCFDPELFRIFEDDEYLTKIDEILERCLKIKKHVVEIDEKEMNERKLLNFGHTFGHAFETYFGLGKYLHGECVGMGMYKIMTNTSLKKRLKKVLERLSCPIEVSYDAKQIVSLIKNDKKANRDTITIVQTDEIGKGYLQEWTMEKISEVAI